MTTPNEPMISLAATVRISKEHFNNSERDKKLWQDAINDVAALPRTEPRKPDFDAVRAGGDAYHQYRREQGRPPQLISDGEVSAILQAALLTTPPLEQTDIEEALQGAWNEFVTDTGYVPDWCLIFGPATTRVVADFRRCPNFLDAVLWRLNRRAKPDAPKPDAPKPDAPASWLTSVTPEQLNL